MPNCSSSDEGRSFWGFFCLRVQFFMTGLAFTFWVCAERWKGVPGSLVSPDILSGLCLLFPQDVFSLVRCSFTEYCIHPCLGNSPHSNFLLLQLYGTLSWVQIMTLYHLPNFSSFTGELGGSWKSQVVETGFSHAQQSSLRVERSEMKKHILWTNKCPSSRCSSDFRWARSIN